jgi:hypothetical protein
VDSKLYDEYAGTYELSRIVVTNEDGHLMAVVTGQAKVELRFVSARYNDGQRRATSDGPR